MLLFTNEQQAFINGERERFNTTQTDLATRMGLSAGPSLIGNAQPVHRDAWARWDREGIEVQRDVLAVFNDLAVNSKPLPIGVLVSHFQRISDSGEVNVSLDGRGKGKRDSPVIDYVGTPIPIVDDEFTFGWRQMEAERQAGFGGLLDTAASNNSQRKIAEKLEDMAINGDTNVVINGATIYGLRNLPQRNTYAHGFTLASATGAQWVTAVTEVLKKLIADNFTTPATIYLNYSDWFYASSTDFAAAYPKTILQKLLEIPGVAKIVPASKVPASDILAVCKRRDVVEVLSAMPIVTRPKARQNPEDDYVFTVMAAAAPQLKYDAAGQCGICHGSTA